MCIRLEFEEKSRLDIKICELSAKRMSLKPQNRIRSPRE